jgi:hypothetical protein
MSVQLTMQDIIMSAILAFIVTSLLIYAWEKLKLKRKRPALSNYSARDINKILQRCYRLFPTDIIQFRGETFHRGMRVHVTTDQKKYFEGQLIGLSKENMICVITNRYIIAQELSKIQNMYECLEEKKV